MTNDFISRLIEMLNTPMEVLNYESASGVVILSMIPDADSIQVIGPYPKDSPEILTALERLKSEDDPKDESPVFYRMVLLFPPSHAEVPSI